MSDSNELRDYAALGAAAIAAGDYARASAITRAAIPVQDLMGLEIVRVGDQSAELTMELTENVRGSAPGTVHGGLLGTLADVASATALNGSYDHDVDVPVTTDIHVRYYRQPRVGPLTATATVVHRGRRLLGTECVIVDAEDRVLARSTATYMVVPTRA